MSRATRPKRRSLARPAGIAAAGLVVVLGALVSVAGLPAAIGVAQGAPEASIGPDAPSAGPLVPPGATGAEPVPDRAGRRAGGPIATCERGPAGVVPAAVVHRGSSSDKVVALTFDDGWGGRTLVRILRTLRQKHVNATFFPTGMAVVHDPTTWRRVADAGFPIANHTFDHGTLEGRCYTVQRLELERAERAYDKVLGVTLLPVMRPPGGLFDDATRAAASLAGAPTLVLWDVDSRDWTGIATRQIAANALGGTRGSIVVLHTSSVHTARALPRIIRGYRKRGFEFVTVGQLLGIEGAVPYPTGTGG